MMWSSSREQKVESPLRFFIVVLRSQQDTLRIVMWMPGRKPWRNSGISSKVSAFAHSQGRCPRPREPFVQHSPSNRIPFAFDGTQTCTRLLAFREILGIYALVN